MLKGKKVSDISMIKDIDTLIGRETTVKGKIEAGGTIRVDGSFEGDIITSGDLVVGESGRIMGTIKACNIVIAGEVEGTIDAKGKLELVPTAKVIGDVKIAVFIVEDGAIFKGQCEMLVPSNISNILSSKRVKMFDNTTSTMESHTKPAKEE